MRYLPHTPSEIDQMLRVVGEPDLESLFKTIPSDLRLRRPLNLPSPLCELELKHHLRELSRKNAHGEEWSFFLGGGSYSHFIPSAVGQLLLRGEFLTAYTPYQPEVSQGTLQAIFEYQTMVSEILGMEIANASHYDGSTGTAEAVLMALRQTERTKVLVARSLHPEYREVLKTYLKNQDAEISEIPFTNEGTLDRTALTAMIDQKTACVVAALPNFFGVVEDLSDVGRRIHEAGGLFVTATTEPLAFGLFAPPGEMGADIAVAEGQSFGIPMAFGGPSLGMFATRREMVRTMPGRLVGETTDHSGDTGRHSGDTGRRGFVLTLATREQHIRRQRATSNICTNVSLCALAAAITLSLWGKKGFQELASLNYQRAGTARKRLLKISGISPRFSGTHFNEFVLRLNRDPEEVLPTLLTDKILAGIPLKRWYPELADSLLVCITEMNRDDEVEKLAQKLSQAVGSGRSNPKGQ